MKRVFWFLVGLIAGVFLHNSIRNKMTALAQQMTIANVASHLWEWTREAVSGLISFGTDLVNSRKDSQHTEV